MTTLAKIWTSAVAYVALAIGAGLSIAGNVADTYRTRGGQTDVLDVVLAVSWPALVVLMVEMFVSTLWPATKPMQAIRWIGCLAIGAMAMRVSWVHLNDLLASRGQDADVATIGPLAIDALAIMATALILSGRGQLATPMVATEPRLATLPSDEAIEAATWRDPWDLATPISEATATWPTEEDVAGRAAATEPPGPDVDSELASWTATTSGQQVVAKAKEKVATTARKSVASYDQDEVRSFIRKRLGQGALATDIDREVASRWPVSERTARRLRAQITGEPVSGPPSDIQNGDEGNER